jgi:hypothetical protein
VNNIFSAGILLYTNGKTVSTKGALGPVDYNWVGGLQWHGTPKWFGAHNVFADFTEDWDGHPVPGHGLRLGKEKRKAIRKRLWDDTSMPDFLLDKDSPCRNAGLDLSKPFTLEGREYAPLPGMKPGYYSGPAPDLGAVQYGEKPFFLDFFDELPRDPKLTKGGMGSGLDSGSGGALTP